MSDQPDGPPNLNFSDVYKHEREEIQKRREKQSYLPPDQTEPRFVGLALSGGGIRSATFCLGFLQELHSLKLLRIFDYLSTVSGGGYLGGWWSAWLSRSEESIRDINEEPHFNREDIHHPVSLLLKIKEGADPVSQALREQLKSNESGRLALTLSTKKLEEWDKLCETLVFHLNSYILKTSERASVDEEGSEVDKRLALELGWEARVKLVETFPYELRNIFPPPEKIEPDRARLPQEKSSDGSRCAWEDPVHHLRLFANYLTPRKGMLSADTWRAISVVIRNLTLTWLILLPLLTGVMLLGQAYFLLNGRTRGAFTEPGKSELLTTALIQISIPVGVLLVWTVLMGIAWLLCNRDNSSAQDSTIQTTCLLALVVLIVYALAQFDPLQNWLPKLYAVKGFFFTSIRSLKADQMDQIPLIIQLRLIVGWAVLTVGLMMFLWYWRLDDRRFPMADSETLARWKREVRRSRFSRAQARLLVITAIVAAILLLSWFSCFLSLGDFGGGAPAVGGMWRNPITFISLISAIGGSIFTAMRATPVANGDRSDTREPALISRIIFAASPPLVVAVLAVIAAWFSHWLLVYYMKSQHQQFIEIKDFLKLASILSIGLCMGLALYEMQNLRWSKILQLSVTPVIFLCLLMINIVWAGQAVFVNPIKNSSPGFRLSAFLGGFITILVFRRIIPRGKWKWRLFRRLKLTKKIEKGKNKSEKNEHTPILLKLRLGSVLAGVLLSTALAVFGYVIGTLVHVITTFKEGDLLLRAGVLTIVALSGGLILFRLLITRHREPGGDSVIRLYFFKDASFSKRPEALWASFSSCLILPIVLLTVAHYVNSYGSNHDSSPPMMAFPIFIGLLLFTMMVLRSLVIQKSLVTNRPLVGWSAGIFNWLLGRIPKVRQHRNIGYQLIALLAVCLPPVIDMVSRKLWPIKDANPMSITAIDWRISAPALLFSLPLFGLSIFQLPVKAELYEVFKSSPRRILHSQTFLWILASLCIIWAFAAGLLLHGWLSHVAEITSKGGFTRVLLPVATGCFLMAVFEFRWGQRDNRRSLNLIAFAYAAIASIFFLRLAGAGPEWQIVPGLLAAICVWVGALGWMVDPNSVSMHQFYKGRLVRAYLGASNVRRLMHRDKEITETVAGDDLPLKSLRNCDHGGPYHLINTTLNLVAGRDLATAQRAASSFVLSQRHCGSARTNYCATEEYMNGQLTLGTAVAASGAAVSPNMGAKKPTAALAMLMTLLNVRLGYWAPTPNREGWNSSQPRLWPFYLVREFLSQTNDLSDYCYLTDGGHFDNTGLYSLIERGCRYIVVVDCGADPKPACFEDFGEAIRRCRIDFGTEIKLSLDPFLETSKGDRCFAIGKIVFSSDHLRTLGIENCYDENLRTGTIVYFKPAVMEDVTPDVRQYAIENKNFPQQPTTNQWFGEAQFESYRQLGQLCAKQAFDSKQVREMSKSPTVSLRDIDQVFSNVGKAERH